MYIKFSYFTDGSGKPEIFFYPQDNPEERDDLTRESMLVQAMQDIENGRKVAIYKIHTLSGVPTVIYGGDDL